MLDKPVEEIVYEEGKVVGVKSQGEVGHPLVHVLYVGGCTVIKLLYGCHCALVGCSLLMCDWRPQLFH